MKVLVVEPQSLMREGTLCLLRSLMPGIIATGAGDGGQAFTDTTGPGPDLLLTELLLPDYSGLELCRRVQQRWRNTAIVFLTSSDDSAMVRQAMAAGARGFLNKQCTPSELVAAVRTVSAGDTYLQHSLATRLALGGKQKTDHRVADITQRELEILILVARGHNNPGIARQLSISTKTVANHLSLLKNKLQASSSLELLHIAVDAGLVQYGRPVPCVPAGAG